MKPILEYLISKAKHPIAKSECWPDGYCLVVAYNAAFNKLRDDSGYAIIGQNGSNPYAAIMKRNDAKKWITIHNVYVFEIPEEYKNIVDFIDAYENGKIDFSRGDLKRIENYEDL